jgi:ketosteroid isomerase-like protein
MSQENVDLLRWVASMANKGDMGAMDAVAETIYHPEAEARDLQPAPGMPELMEGRAAVVAVWRQWLEVLDEWRIEIHEIVDADPWVVSDVHWFAKGRGSEVTIDWRVTEAHRFRDGKIACSIFGYPDVATALEAVGLSEQDAHADS